MSDRYIPREGRPLTPEEIQPAGPRSEHLIEKTAEYLRTVKGGDQAVVVAIKIWQIFRQHSTCDMGD